MNGKIFYGLFCVCLVFVVILLYVSSHPTEKTNLIRVGYNIGNIDHAPFFIANKKDFFNKRNISIETVPLISSNEVKLALSAGQLDVAFSTAPTFFGPISKGAPIKMIAPMGAAPTYLYVRPDSKMKTLQDLLGKAIALSPGGSNEYYIRYILKQENIDVSKIEFINVDKANRPVALMDKKIVDAVPIGEEELAQYSKIGAIPLEEWDTKGYSNRQTPETFIGVNEKFKLSHPVLVEQFLDAMIDGHRFIKSNPKEAAQIVADYIKEESEGSFEYLPENIISIWKNKKLKSYLWYDPAPLIEMSKIAVEIGQIESNLTLDQMFDLNFEKKLKKAQNEIYPAS